MNYELYRNQIKDGDILLYKGKSLLSKAIRLLTKSEYSHAGIAIWWKDRLMVLEATGKGVFPIPMSKNLKHYKGIVHCFTSKKYIPQVKRTKMMHFAMEEIGKEYSKWKLVVFGYILIFGKNKDKRDEFRKTNSLVCSHYVAQIYTYSGEDLKKGVSDAFTLPEDIAKSDKLTYKHTLKYVQ